jgi:replicative DNA helicase
MKRRRFLGILISASFMARVPNLQKAMLRRDSYRDDIEKATLGSLMLDARQVPKVVSILQVRHFSSRERGLVFQVIRCISRDANGGDLESVADVLSETGFLSYIGGHEALVEMVESTPNPAKATAYAESLLEISL